MTVQHGTVLARVDDVRLILGHGHLALVGILVVVLIVASGHRPGVEVGLLVAKSSASWSASESEVMFMTS